MNTLKSKELKVGAMVLVAFSLLYVGLRFLKGINFFSSSNTYYAVYTHVDGLIPSNPVLVNGLNVGMVTDIEILQDQGNQLKVEMLIDRKVKLGPKTVAELASNGLLGSKIIKLNVETNISEPLESGAKLLSQEEKPFTAVVADQAAPIVDKLEKLLTDFQGSGAEAKNMMHSLAQTSASVDSLVLANQYRIALMLSNISQTSAQLTTTLAALDPTLKNVEKITADVASTDLSETVDHLNNNLLALQDILGQVNNGEGNMGKLLKDEALYENINHTVQSMDSLLMDLKEHPKRYVHFSMFGKKDKAEKEKK
ncbi:MlaD family protein [Persicobacter sp. CCB-QB2]|uniref:MlaD family protein n=1 Tax=Persicobacter sp. CCB-QB2 TaxID=1561025 RepID=UPI0006A97903|nr:MlaD family protein [Persicobacter sp. CCB-QB2]